MTASPARPDLAGPAARPSPLRWAREHLFATPGGTMLTVATVLVAGLFVRGIVGFVVADTRRWGSVAANLRMLATQTYPPDRYVRVWVAVGIVAALAGISLAVWRPRGRVPARRMGTLATGTGSALVFVAAASAGVVAPGTTAVLGAGGAAVASAGWVVRNRARASAGASVLGIGAAAVVLLVAALWTLPIGRHGFAAGELLDPAPGTVAASTRVPWTLLAVVLFAAHAAGRAAARRFDLRAVLAGCWVLSMPVISLVVLRAPDLSGWQAGRDLAAYAAAAAAGTLVAAAPDRAWMGPVRVAVVAGAVVAACWPGSLAMVVRLPAALLAAFTIAAPAFGGRRGGRGRYAAVWLVSLTALTFLVAMGGVPSSVGFQSSAYLGGLTLTLVLAAAGILISLPLGLVLALARTSEMPVFRVLAIGFIEVARGMPFLVVLLIADRLLRVMLPQILTLDDVVTAIAATGLYFAAYMAENFRGGLQAVPAGQVEAARAIGLTPLQTTAFVVVPQAVRAVVPALVGQAITIFKETSLVAIVGMWDLLYIGAKVVPQQSAFLGALRENLLFVAAVYWVFTFSMSRAGLRVERRLGLGESSHYGAL